MTPMTDLVMRKEGTIDKYIGDALMAIWNAPLDVDNHAQLAVETAQEMEVELKKLNKELPALTIPPMPGPKGIEIMNSISEEAWEMWKSHQTTLINEKHLDMSDPENRIWLQDQMDKFFNNEDYEIAAGFKALD